MIKIHVFFSKARQTLYPITVASFCFWSFCFNATFPYLKSNVGLHITFWTYGSLSIIGSVATFVFIPETKNKSSEEVASFFDEAENAENTLVQFYITVRKYTLLVTSKCKRFILTNLLDIRYLLYHIQQLGSKETVCTTQSFQRLLQCFGVLLTQYRKFPKSSQ